MKLRLGAICALLVLVACDRAAAPAASPSQEADVSAAAVDGGASARTALVEPSPPPEVFDVRVGRIEKKKTLTSTLQALGLDKPEVDALFDALRPVFDFRKIRIGDQLRVTRGAEGLAAFEYRASPIDEWLVVREEGRLVGRKREVELTKRIETVDLTVEGSLYESMVESGEDPALAVEVADVFAFDIDFYRDVRSGDRLRVIVEKIFAHGRLLRYGAVLGARYEGEQVGSRKLLRYVTVAGETTYFDEKGTSAKKPFLKSPLKFVHITSRYGGRKHPLKGFYHQHNGVDFAAAVGTPVWSVADGVVSRVVRGDPAGGHYLFVRHTNGFETGYLHLSRFAEGIAPGMRVQQKQVIAYSGNTGSSTGPHLHFAMKRGGHYVNPWSQKFPRSQPLATSELGRFREHTADVAAMLDAQVVAAR